MKKAVLLFLGAMVVAAIAIAVLDPESLSGPDAEQQEKAVTACLRNAGFSVRSGIPPLGPRTRRNPEYEVEVGREGEVVAYIYLFDSPEQAEAFVDEARLDAEVDDEQPTVEQRDRAAVDLDSGASSTPKIRACVDRAVQPRAQ